MMIANKKTPVGTADPYVITAKKNQNNAKVPIVAVESKLRDED